jgi:arylsulfatase A-like enzyme
MCGLKKNAKPMKLLYGIVLLAGLFCVSSCRSPKGEDPTPNIIFILADDLGYGDLGCYGQELIETPHLDELASKGMRFTQHYSGSPVCAPSRCVLLTGKHSGHAYIRGNDEWGERGEVWDYRAMIADSTLEGQRPLPAGTTTIATLLQAEGYRTGMIGKWGLGAPHTNGIPNRLGFDFYCGYNCQRQAHTYYPVHLYLNEKRLYLDNDTIAPHSKLPDGADPHNPESYADFTLKDYAPDVMFSQMIDFVKRAGQDPFFLYWASPIPHVALQAPQRWVDYYVEKFGEEEPYLGEAGYFPCRYPHATYAAMISTLDERIGALINTLKAEGTYENTLIVFSSDNGPTFNGGTDSPWFHSGGPFKSERGWGKAYLHEGGIRVPLIASWPGHIDPGTESDHLSAFWDLLPTLCEAAGASLPEGLDGISYLPELLGEGEQEKHPYLYWEFPASGGQQAVRMEHWKAIRKNIRQGNMTLELFNLEEDLQELHDVADEEPGLVQQMELIMEQEHSTPELERFRMKALDGKHSDQQP